MIPRTVPVLVALAAAACDPRPTNQVIGPPPGVEAAKEAIRAVYERALGRELRLDVELVWVAGEPSAQQPAPLCLQPFSDDHGGGCALALTFFYGGTETWLVHRDPARYVGPVGNSGLAHELLHVALMETYFFPDDDHSFEWWARGSAVTEAELAAADAAGEPVPDHLR